MAPIWFPKSFRRRTANFLTPFWPVKLKFGRYACMVGGVAARYSFEVLRSSEMKSKSPGGIFKIGGDLAVHRLGFGAMRITGPGIWGEPKDPAAMRRLLRKTWDLGVN